MYFPEERRDPKGGAFLEMGAGQHSALHQRSLTGHSQGQELHPEPVQVYAGADKLSPDLGCEVSLEIFTNCGQLLPSLFFV